jgi:hypothetical protein
MTRDLGSGLFTHEGLSVIVLLNRRSAGSTGLFSVGRFVPDRVVIRQEIWKEERRLAGGGGGESDDQRHGLQSPVGERKPVTKAPLGKESAGGAGRPNAT